MYISASFLKETQLSGISTAATAALLAVLVIGAVAHGILRIFLEARGVRPWTLSDSLGSLPLVLIGTLLTFMGAMLLANPANSPVSAAGNTPIVHLVLLALVLAGLFLIRLGIFALKKLT